MSLKSFLKNLKLNEDTIKSVFKSLLLVVFGVIALNFFLKEKGQIMPPIEIGDEMHLPATHQVAKGEDLWNISEKYYGTGYNWVDIASVNEISNPNIIAEGQELNIPKVAPKLILGTSPAPVTEEVALAAPEKTNEVFEENYKIQKGDSLWTIAEKNYNSGYNWVDIASENKLTNPNIITEGQELKLPKVETKVPTVKGVSTPEVKAIEGDSYTVEKGDNLWTIAVRAYGDGYKWPEIAKKNSLKNPDTVLVGQTLNLPR